jgi:hypothetical protein
MAYLKCRRKDDINTQDGNIGSQSLSAKIKQ